MQIIKGSITYLTETGHLTLQIPDSWIGDKPEMEDAPDEWFIRLKNDRPITSKRESGFLYLTKAGWEANKEKFHAVLKENPRGATWYTQFGEVSNYPNRWENMLARVEEHFQRVEKATQKYLKHLKQKIAALESTTL